MEIRKMEERDRETVLSMMRVFYASPAVSTNGSEEIFGRDIDACVLENPYAEGFVFIENGESIGYAMLAKSFSTEFGKPCIWIEDLYLTEGNRGKGIGTAFLQFVVQRYPNAVIRLEAEEENENAIAVYRKNSFEEIPYMELIRHA